MPVGEWIAWAARVRKVKAWWDYIYSRWIRRSAALLLALTAALLLCGCAIMNAIGAAIDVSPYPPAQPTVTATAAPPSPTVAPTAAPTAGPTATPTSGFILKLRYYNCGGCNPDNPHPGGTCTFDCTPWGTMVSFDVLPKGAGCERYSDEKQPGQQWSPRENCLRNDSEGTPCGGAPACDPDHLFCERVNVSCGGQEWHLPPPVITATGIVCQQDLNGGFGGHCQGTPGAIYSFQADPPAGFPIPVHGSGRFWRAGTF